MKKDIFKFNATSLITLGSWFVLVLLLSMCNKMIFVFLNFKFPVLLSCLNMIFVAILSNIVYYFTKVIPDDDKQLSPAAVKMIRMFVLFFVLDICLANISISMISLVLFQVIRVLVLVGTVIGSYLFLDQFPHFLVLMSLIPSLTGVIMVILSRVKEPFHYSQFGIVVSLIGVVVCVCKVIVKRKSLVKYKIHSLVMLSYLSFYSTFVMFVISVIIGEFREFLEFNFTLFDFLCANSLGIVVFVFHLVSMVAYKNNHPITMTVAGDLRKVVVVLLSVIIFQTKINLYGYVGIGITFFGTFLYSILNQVLKRKKKEAPQLKVTVDLDPKNPIEVDLDPIDLEVTEK